MTAPIDRAYVELVPDTRRFAEQTKAAVKQQVSAASGQMGKIGDAAENEMKRTEGAFSRGFGRIKESIKGFIAPVLGAFAAIGTFEFFKGAFESAEQIEKLGKQTEAVLKSTGGAAHVTAKQVDDLARSLSNQTGVARDVIQNNENLLLTFTNIQNRVGKGNDIFDQATKAVLDMSVALKEDGKSASIQLGKALNDPIKGITALQRVGVAFTAQQKEQIKTLVTGGHTLAAQKIILRELNREFGGSAAAQATGVDKLKNMWHNLQIELGQKMLPVVEKVAEFFSSKVIPVLGKLFSSTGAVGGAVHMFVVGFKDNMSQAGNVWARAGGIIRAVITNLVAAAKNLWVALLPLIKGLRDDAIKAWTIFANLMTNDVIPALKDVGNWIKQHAGLVRVVAVVVLTFIATWKVFSGVYRAWKAAQEALNVVMRANPILLIVSTLAALVLAFIYAYKHSEKFRDTVNGVLKNLGHAFDNFMHAIDNLKHAWDNVFHAGENVVHALTDVYNFLKKWGPTILAIIAPVLGIPLLIWQHWSQIKNFLVRAWHDVWTFLKTWGPLALSVLVPFIGIPLLIWQHFSAIKGFIQRAWDAGVQAIKTGISNGISAVKRLPGMIKNALADAGTWLLNIGKNVVKGLWSGLASLGGWLIDKVKGLIPGWIRKALGIKSPPQWAIDIGKWIAKGLVNGIYHFPGFIGNLAKDAALKLAAIAKSIGKGFTQDAPYLASLNAEYDYAKSQFARFGWNPNGQDWVNLYNLWVRESGWNPHALNKSSGAYGIPQALPASKLASAGPNWKDDPATQINWGLGYIFQRYGSPSAAWAHELQYNWYQGGAWNILRDQLALLHKGETVVPRADAEPWRKGVMAGSVINYDKLSHAVASAVTAAFHMLAGRGSGLTSAANLSGIQILTSFLYLKAKSGEDSFRKTISKQNFQLQQLAKERQAIGTRLMSVNNYLIAMQQAFQQKAAATTQQLMGGFDVTQLGVPTGGTPSLGLADVVKAVQQFGLAGGQSRIHKLLSAQAASSQGVTVGSIIADAKAKASQLIQFRAQINHLRALGLNTTLLDQLINQGPSDQAAALAKASKSQIAVLNQQYAIFGKQAKAIGTTSAQIFYQSGIAAAQGLVKGLRSQQSAIEKQMARLAQAMIKEFKRALGIKSPSEEFAKLGVHSAVGYALGLDRGAPAVKAAALRMGKAAMTSANSSPTPYRGGTAWNEEKFAVAIARALHNATFRFDSDGFVRLVTTKQAAAAARGARQ